MTRILLVVLSLLSGYAIGGSNFIGNEADAKELAEEDKKWRTAIDDFAKSSTKDVLNPYMQLITGLSHHPEHNSCTDNVQGLVNQAIELNPSSLVAYSMLYTCATKNHNTELKAKYLKSINGLIRNLVGGNAADSIDTVIEIREMMEAPLLLQAMGYTVLDIDMVTRYGSLYYQYHVMDPLNSTVTVRYFTNLMFMKRMLSNPNVSDDVAAQLLVQYYEQQKMDFALNAKAKNFIARKQYQDALEVLNTIEPYSMIRNVQLARIFIETKQEQALSEIRKELEFDAKSGFIEAHVMLAAIKLREQPDEHAEQIRQHLAQVDQYTKPGEGAYRLSVLMEKTDEVVLKQRRLEYLKQAVAMQHPTATYSLARLYRSKKETPSEEKQAMELFEKAKNLGVDEAAIEIANYLHQGSDSVAVDHQSEVALLRRLAEQNNHTAQYMLALRYNDGVDLEQDAKQAFHYYLKAHDSGNIRAANQIGILYETGALSDDGQEDLPNAYHWYQKAANRGDGNGFSNMARFHHFGMNGPVDLNKAANYYIRAAETGSYLAYCKLADAMLQIDRGDSEKWQDTLSRAESLYLYGARQDTKYCPGRLGKFYLEELDDPDKASYWLETAARSGDNKALDLLELLFFKSYVEKDYATAFEKLRKGAQLGMVKATYQLGQMYHLGQGTERNDLEAMDYFERADQLGHPGAQKAIVKLLLQGQDSVKDVSQAKNLLEQRAKTSLEATITTAEWFFYGWGFDKDYQLAMHFYKKAAELGSGNAINHLGEMYRYGWGVEVDFDQAKRWYLEAVKVDYVIAAHNIAEMYYLGEGVEQNYLVAFDWFQKSAAKNLSHSRYFLGKMYQAGHGVNQDLKMANRLFYQAMDQRHNGAKFELGKNMIQGLGIATNEGRGLLFITEAAEAGFEEAQAYLKSKSD